MLTKLVRNNPSDFFTGNLSLIVYPLDREKAFPQALGPNNIMLKLCSETLTIPDGSGVNAVNSR
jgi:hypothetical protein